MPPCGLMIISANCMAWRNGSACETSKIVASMTLAESIPNKGNRLITARPHPRYCLVKYLPVENRESDVTMDSNLGGWLVNTEDRYIAR